MASRKRKLQHATVIGVFATRSEAEAALRELRGAGFVNDALGLVARNASGEMVDESGETYADEGAVAGTVAGVGVGALIGVGVLSGVIPVVGPAIFAGTLGTLLTNALGGAAVVGITGALIGWGIPEDEAEYYEAEVKAGRCLVTVEAGDRTDEARAILHRHGGYNQTRAATLPAADPATPARPRAKRAARRVAVAENPVTLPAGREEVVGTRRPSRRKK